MIKTLHKLTLVLLFNLYAIAANAAGVSLFGDFLLWHASEQTAATWNNELMLSQSNTIFSPRNINFTWDTGFRAGLQYSPSSFFDTTLYWTYFSTRRSQHTALGTGLVIPELFSGYISGDTFIGADLKWNILLNSVDLEASHAFRITPSFSLRPSLGIKGASIKQTIDVNWNGAEDYNATERVTHDFLGVGPSLGLGIRWNIYPTVDFIGEFSTAFLWGNWNINDTYIRPELLNGFIPSTTVTTRMNNAGLGTLMFDYFVGVETHPEKSRASFRFGYEMQSWANQLRLTTFQQLPVHGDLTFQGITCRVTFD